MDIMYLKKPAISFCMFFIRPCRLYNQKAQSLFQHLITAVTSMKSYLSRSPPHKLIWEEDYIIHTLWTKFNLLLSAKNEEKMSHSSSMTYTKHFKFQT